MIRPRIHHVDCVAEGRGEPEIVRDQEHAHLPLVDEPAEQIDDARLRRDIERRSRLVGDQDIRVDGDRHRDHHALTHSARELVRVAVEAARRNGNADVPEQIDRASARSVLGDVLVDADRLDDLVTDRVHRVQRGHRVLVDERDLPHRTDDISRARDSVVRSLPFKQHLAAGDSTRMRAAVPSTRAPSAASTGLTRRRARDR